MRALLIATLLVLAAVHEADAGPPAKGRRAAKPTPVNNSPLNNTPPNDAGAAPRRSQRLQGKRLCLHEAAASDDTSEASGGEWRAAGQQRRPQPAVRPCARACTLGSYSRCALASCHGRAAAASTLAPQGAARPAHTCPAQSHTTPPAIAPRSHVGSVPCHVCEETEGSADMVLCDGCNRGFHTYCYGPLEEGIPPGNWYCDSCAEQHPNGARLLPARAARCLNCMCPGMSAVSLLSHACTRPHHHTATACTQCPPPMRLPGAATAAHLFLRPSLRPFTAHPSLALPRRVQ